LRHRDNRRSNVGRTGWRKKKLSSAFTSLPAREVGHLSYDSRSASPLSRGSIISKGEKPSTNEPLALVRLAALMKISEGIPETGVGLMDGPVVIDHPDLASENIREVPGGLSSRCARTDSVACTHGTFVAGILSAKRGSSAPAICPACTLLVQPIFKEATTQGNGQLPSASPGELADAILECIRTGAQVLNLSLALAQPSSREERKLEEALDYAARRGVIVVAAAGNQGAVASSAITRHPWVIPVVGCELGVDQPPSRTWAVPSAGGD
jgi:subtilisin family serine protease